MKVLNISYLCILFLTFEFNIKIIHMGVTLAEPDNAENRENGVRRDGKFPSLAENAAQMRRWTTFINIYIPDDRNSRNQVRGLVTSQAT